MTAPTPQSQAQQAPQEQKPNDKELNFRALEAKYQKELQQERGARLEAEKAAQEALARKPQPVQEDDDDDDEPYVQKKKLQKKLANFGQQQHGEIQKAMEMAKEAAKEELRQEVWLENNPDFYDVLEKNADKLAQRSPSLAKSILAMPNNFERQKLVYQSIKELGLNKPEAKQPSIQEKIDSNRRSPYYQPSGVSTAPYTTAGDFSESGQKQAYAKLQELKKNLRI